MKQIDTDKLVPVGRLLLVKEIKPLADSKIILADNVRITDDIKSIVVRTGSKCENDIPIGAEVFYRANTKYMQINDEYHLVSEQEVSAYIANPGTK